MKVHFYLHYATKFGESFSLCLPGGARHPLEYLTDELWHTKLHLDAKDFASGLAYSYEFYTADGLTRPEADTFRRLDFEALNAEVLEVYDFFNPMGLLENVFTTQPFRAPEAPVLDTKSAQSAKTSHVFKVKALMLEADELVCLLGHGIAL